MKISHFLSEGMATKNSPSAYIIFSAKRVQPLIRFLEAGLNKNAKSSVGTMNQFAGKLWAQAKESGKEWSDEEIVAMWAEAQRQMDEMPLSREQLKRGMKMEKKNAPCARLYSCVGNKGTGGAKPTTRHVSSECWSHERVDPETGALLTPHKCPWLHPGEPGWREEWNIDRLFKPPAAAESASRKANVPVAERSRSRSRSRSSAQRANKQARNTAEEKARRNLNARESRNAAAAIFANKSKKNKPKWGIPNLGPGFGGGRSTRKNRGSRRRGV